MRRLYVACVGACAACRVQVRIVGLALTFALTLVFHPQTWRYIWNKGCVVQSVGVIRRRWRNSHSKF